MCSSWSSIVPNEILSMIMDCNPAAFLRGNKSLHKASAIRLYDRNVSKDQSSAIEYVLLYQEEKYIIHVFESILEAKKRCKLNKQLDRRFNYSFGRTSPWSHLHKGNVLEIAAATGKLEVTKYLLDRYHLVPPYDPSDEKCIDPFTCAVQGRQVETAKLLIEHDWEASRCTDVGDKFFFSIAVGLADLVGWFIEQKGLDPNITLHGRTALHRAVQGYGMYRNYEFTTATMKRLLDLGADIRTASSEMATTLQYACLEDKCNCGTDFSQLVESLLVEGTYLGGGRVSKLQSDCKQIFDATGVLELIRYLQK
ncbi:hypothetical protein FOWG_17584 [Fusarium oxysporum f. sp. lycopersici MN25]|nr:hypothetical protein FOWG_17584 [Fusarium oxysporum f. sp. lycopersici MN25]